MAKQKERKEMKKILLLSVVALTGCVQQKIDIEYKQVGSTCEYVEQRSTVELTGDRPIETRTIKYPNTQCSKVIDSDLKNDSNKTLIK